MGPPVVAKKGEFAINDKSRLARMTSVAWPLLLSYKSFGVNSLRLARGGTLFFTTLLVLIIEVVTITDVRAIHLGNPTFHGQAS